MCPETGFFAFADHHPVLSFLLAYMALGAILAICKTIVSARKS